MLANAFTRWHHKYMTVAKRLVYKHCLEGQLCYHVVPAQSFSIAGGFQPISN